MTLPAMVLQFWGAITILVIAALIITSIIEWWKK